MPRPELPCRCGQLPVTVSQRPTAPATSMMAVVVQPSVAASLPLRYLPIRRPSREMSITTMRNGPAARTAVEPPRLVEQTREPGRPRGREDRHGEDPGAGAAVAELAACALRASAVERQGVVRGAGDEPRSEHIEEPPDR